MRSRVRGTRALTSRGASLSPRAACRRRAYWLRAMIDRPAGQEEIQHGAKPEHVGPRADPVLEPARLLGTRISRRTADRAGRLEQPGMGHTGQAEVDEPRLAVRTDQDVRRLDVLVDDAAGIQVRDGVGQLRDEPSRLSGEGTSLADEFIQGQALDIFHDDEGTSVEIIEIEHADQVGVLT